MFIHSVSARSVGKKQENLDEGFITDVLCGKSRGVVNGR